MNLVVDANILFAALIKESQTIELMFNENINLFAPEFLFEEFAKYKEEIIKKTKRTETELKEVLDMLKSIITFIPKEEFEEFLREAIRISPDKNDIQYIALALKLKLPIWSNDKELKNKQNKIKVYHTKELMNI